MPDVDLDLHHWQREAGASFNPDGRATTFGNDKQAIEALGSGVVLYDASHFARVRVAAPARTALLATTTRDLTARKPQEALEACLIEPTTGAVVDVVTICVQPNAHLILGSPGATAAISTLLTDRLADIDMSQKSSIQDLSGTTGLLLLAGPEAIHVLEELGVAPDILATATDAAMDYTRTAMLNFEGHPVVLIAGGPLGSHIPAVMLLAAEEAVPELYRQLALRGCILMGDVAFDRARILAGRPIRGTEYGLEGTPRGREMKDDDIRGWDMSPMDLAQGHAVDAIYQSKPGEGSATRTSCTLWGLRMQFGAPLEVGDEVVDAESGETVGVVTSATNDASGFAFGMTRVTYVENVTDKKVLVHGKSGFLESPPAMTRAASM